MTEEEQIEYIKAKTQGEMYNRHIFEKYKCNMTNRHNPEFVKSLKGTEFEGNPDIAPLVTLERWKEKIKVRYNNSVQAWTNLFGSSDVYPFKKIQPRDLMGKYLAEAEKEKVADLPIHAVQWLKRELVNERRNLNLNMKEKDEVGNRR